MTADEKSSQELVLKTVKNRKRSGYVDCQQVGSIDRNLFFLQTKATHFKRMMTTVDEVNSAKTKVLEEFIFRSVCLIVLLPNSMSKVIHNRCKLTCKLLIK